MMTKSQVGEKTSGKLLLEPTLPVAPTDPEFTEIAPDLEITSDEHLGMMTKSKGLNKIADDVEKEPQEQVRPPQPELAESEPVGDIPALKHFGPIISRDVDITSGEVGELVSDQPQTTPVSQGHTLEPLLLEEDAPVLQEPSIDEKSLKTPPNFLPPTPNAVPTALVEAAPDVEGSAIDLIEAEYEPEQSTPSGYLDKSAEWVADPEEWDIPGITKSVQLPPPQDASSSTNQQETGGAVRRSREDREYMVQGVTPLKRQRAVPLQPVRRLDEPIDEEVDVLESLTAEQVRPGMRRLILGKVALPYNGVVKPRVIAVLTTPGDIHVFLNSFQEEMLEMIRQYKDLPFADPASLFNQATTKGPIPFERAERIYNTLYTPHTRTVTYNGIYVFEKLNIDMESPLLRGVGISTVNRVEQPRLVEYPGHIEVDDFLGDNTARGLTMPNFVLSIVNPDSPGTWVRPFVFSIQFTEPIYSRDKALHYMTRLFNVLIGKPGPWFTPGNTAFTMRRNYAAFVRLFLRRFSVYETLAGDDILLSRFVMHPFTNQNRPYAFRNVYLGVVNRLRIYPLPDLIEMIIKFAARYETRMLEEKTDGKRIVNLSTWYLEIAKVPRDYNRVTGFRQLPLPIHVNKELECEGMLLDDRGHKGIQPPTKPFIVVDPSEGRNRKNKYCLAVVVWLGVKLSRMNKPRLRWLPVARAWISNMCRRNNIDNFYRMNPKFVSDRLFFRKVLRCFNTEPLRRKCFVILDRNFNWRQCYYLDPEIPGYVREVDHRKTNRYPPDMRNLEKIYVLKIETHAFLALPRNKYPQFAHLDTDPYSINPAVKHRWTKPARELKRMQYFIVGDTETYPSPKDNSEVVYMAQLADRYKTHIWCLEPSPTNIDEVLPTDAEDLDTLRNTKIRDVHVYLTLNPVKSKIEYLIEHRQWYHGKILFYHNLSGFDFILIFREFMKCGFNFVGQPISGAYGGIGRVSAVHNSETVKVNLTRKNADGEQITVDRKFKIILSDSYSLFSQSLGTLTKSLGVTHSKIDFDTLSVTSFNYVRKMVEILQYAINDVRGLYEMLEIMGKRILEQGCNYLCCPTSTSVSNRTFLVHYYDPSVAPIYNLSYRDSQFISRAYHGGRTECFHLGIIPVPAGKHIEFYDINSAYPDKMCHDLPIGAPFKTSLRSDKVHTKGQARFIGDWRKIMNGSREKYSHIEFDRTGRNVKYEEFTGEVFFGFVSCIVVGGYSDQSTIPLLPYKYNGKNVYPIFRKPTSVVLSTAFLDEIWDKGLPYQVEFMYEAIHFRSYPIFKEFVLNFYIQRQIAKEEGDKSQDMILKSILNQLYGRTAFERIRKYFEFIKTDKDLLAPEFQYDRGILQAIRFENQIMLQKYGFCDTKLAAINIAAFVTSKAQIHIHQALTQVRTSDDALLLYCDTDSVQLVVPDNEREKEPPRFPISKNLGEWDYEGGPYHYGCVNQKKNYYLASKELFFNPNNLTNPDEIRDAKLDHYNIPNQGSKADLDELLVKREKNLKKFGFKGISRKTVDGFYWSTWKRIAQGLSVSVIQNNSKTGLRTYFDPDHCGKIYRSKMQKKASRSRYFDGLTDKWDVPEVDYAGPLKPLIVPPLFDALEKKEFIGFLNAKDWFYGHTLEK